MLTMCCAEIIFLSTEITDMIPLEINTAAVFGVENPIKSSFYVVYDIICILQMQDIYFRKRLILQLKRRLYIGSSLNNFRLFFLNCVNCD